MTTTEDIAVFVNYSGIYNGFRHIIADNDTPVKLWQTYNLKENVTRKQNKRIKR